MISLTGEAETLISYEFGKWQSEIAADHWLQQTKTAEEEMSMLTIWHFSK